MAHQGSTTDNEVLAVLELLAQKAPPCRFEALLQRPRRDDPESANASHLERAVQLAREIHSTLSRSQQREAGFSAIVDTARDLTHSYDLDTLLRVIARRMRQLLHFDITYVSLRNQEGELYIHTSEGAITALNGLRIQADNGLGHRALQVEAPLWTADYLSSDSIVHSDSIDEVVRAEGLHALMAVPLRHGDTAAGVLYGADRKMRHYTPDEIGLICSFANLVAVAIEKTGSLQQAQDQVTELELDGFHTRTNLARCEQLGDVFGQIMSLLVAGADLTSVAKAAGDALDGTLQMRDPAGRELAASGEMPGLDEEAVYEAILEAHGQRTPVVADEHTWVIPVTAGPEDLGALVLLPMTQLVGEDRRLLEITAQAFAIQLLMQRSAAVAEAPVRDEALHELLTQPPAAHPPHQITQRAHRLGVDLDEPHVLIVARPEGGELGRAVIWASSYAYRLSGLKMVQDGCIVLLLPSADASGAARAIVDELSPLLGHSVSVGAAGPRRGAEAVRQMYQEAVRCLEAMTALDGVGCAAAAHDLGFLGLLLSDDNDVDGFIHATVGPVLDYDAERDTELTRTLESYFASGSSPTNAAEALHVHPNTVSRRLERITELLGAEWQKPSQALDVQLALRLRTTRDALRERRVPSPGQAKAGPEP